MSDISANNNINIQNQIQQQHVQQQNVQPQRPQEQESIMSEKPMMTFSTRPSYMNKGIFLKDQMPGLNTKFGFGDIIYTMAQAGKPTGACGGSFMAVA